MYIFYEKSLTSSVSQSETMSRLVAEELENLKKNAGEAFPSSTRPFPVSRERSRAQLCELTGEFCSV